MTEDIGTRMKRYESNRRVENGAVIIRVDGKAFHTWTDQINAQRPFDLAVIDCMTLATMEVSKEIQGFRLGYTQSDEATFLLINTDDQSPWFGGKLDKLVSVTASMFTYWFNHFYEYWQTTRGYPEVPAFFDARAFNIPIEDAANCFYWRQIDWIRNSVSMLARVHFSQKDLNGRSSTEVKAMLSEKGVDWENLESYEKFGTFVTMETVGLSLQRNYEQINELAGISAT